MENAATRIYILPKRTRIFLDISRRLGYASADFHAYIKSKMVNNSILIEYLFVCSFSTFYANVYAVSNLFCIRLTAAHLPSDGRRLRNHDIYDAP